jgi:peptidoglycan/xylan/chitin deacetylase (PgdA/CDA1 family)
MQYFDSYKEIKKIGLAGSRGAVSTIVLDGLAAFDKLRGIEKDLNKPRIQFLYIHHVFKDEAAKLDALLKKLSVNHSFLSYTDAVAKLTNGTIDKPYIVISADDGFKNNLRAAEVFNNYGINACFFINPGIIGETNYETIKAYCKKRLDLPPVEFLNWQDVEQLQKMGHEIGSHTMGHIDLATTSKEFITDDCHKTFELLHSKCGSAKHFAFPYGRFYHFNEIGRKAIFESGFISCASAERGCHINFGEKIPNEELCIRRDHVIADWDMEHIFHFIARNSRNASFKKNFFPYNKT